MKGRTGIVLGLVVLLGLIYWLTREEKVSVGVMRLELPSFASKDVDRVEIFLGKEIVKLKKIDGAWKVEVGDEKSPKFLAADQGSVEGVLEAASAVRHSHYVTKLPEKLAELGFNEEAKTVKLFSGDKAVWALMLGRDASAGAGRYVKLIDDPNIYVAKGAFWQLTRNGIADFRDKNILKTEEAELTSFTAKRDGKVILAMKRDEKGENWIVDDSHMALPKDFRISSRALESLVRSSTNLVAQGFIDEHKELSHPQFIIDANSKDGKSFHIEFFARNDQEGYFAKKSGDEQIFEVAKYNVERLNKGITEFRDLSVMNVDPNIIVNMTIRGEKGQVSLHKQEGRWQLDIPKKLPEGMEFDDARAEVLVSDISGLTALRIADGKHDVAKNANWLKEPAVALVDDKGSKIELFAVKVKSPRDEYLVKGNIDNEVYVVVGNSLDFLKSGVEAFKKQDFELPVVDEHTKGLESIPPDVRRKLLEMSRQKKK